MSRANDSAFPIQESDLAGSLPAQHGLTVREHFAGQAMSAWVHEYAPCKESYAAIAEASVGLADALIAELAKPVTPEQTPEYRERLAADIVARINENEASTDAAIRQCVLIALEQVRP